MEEVFDPVKYVGYGQSNEDGLVRELFEVQNEIEEYDHKISFFWIFPIVEKRWRYKNGTTKKTVSELRKEAVEKIRKVPNDNYCDLYIARYYWFHRMWLKADKLIWRNGEWVRNEY